jgi:subtilase-type serine protease
LVKEGEGTLLLIGDNSYSGTTELRGGVLAIEGDLALGNSILEMEGGTSSVGNFPAPVQNEMVISGNSAIYGTGNTITFTATCGNRAELTHDRQRARRHSRDR